MSDLTYRVDATNALDLAHRLEDISAQTRRSVPSLIRQTFIFAVQSATKLTAPGDSSKVSTMAQKYRIRPKVRATQMLGRFFYSYAQGSKIFASDTPIRFRPQADRPKAYSSALKFWDKKTNSWGFMPAFGPSSSRKEKIPHFGAAKAGFLHMLGKLGKPADAGSERASLATVVDQLHGDTPSILGINEVTYAGKTSPGAAALGLNRALNRVTHAALNQISRDTERVWR